VLFDTVPRVDRRPRLDDGGAVAPRRVPATGRRALRAKARAERRSETERFGQ